MFGTAHSTKDRGFYRYYQDIGQRIKDREKKKFKDKDRVDILLVVNMFLTGFDAKKVNTLYVDKNLRLHGLIQAYSRTNRILGTRKSQGNIVCFRNLKKNTDDAIALFSNPEANEEILVDPYEDYVKKFNEGVKALKAIAPTYESVNDLRDEEEQIEFVKAFRVLIRNMNVLKTFSEFEFEDLYMHAQEFENYKSKYIDIHERNKRDEEPAASIINEVDFELELIQRDEVNVAYILRLLADMHESGNSDDDEEKKDANDKRKRVLDLLGSEPQLRSKRDLIERFIEQNMPELKPNDDVFTAFSQFWNSSKIEALKKLCEEEGLIEENVEKIISDYNFTQLRPLRDNIVATLKTKPKILERKKIVERVMEKLIGFIQTFDDDIGELNVEAEYNHGPPARSTDSAANQGNPSMPQGPLKVSSGLESNSWDLPGQYLASSALVSPVATNEFGDSVRRAILGIKTFEGVMTSNVERELSPQYEPSMSEYKDQISFFCKNLRNTLSLKLERQEDSLAHVRTLILELDQLVNLESSPRDWIDNLRTWLSTSGKEKIELATSCLEEIVNNPNQASL